MVLQELIEAEATDVIGTGRYERSDTRTNERNGARPRILATQPATSTCASRSCAWVRSSADP